MVWEPHRYEFVRASYHDEAEYLRLCLDLDLVTVARVIAWADELVAALPQPPVEIIDLALQPNETPDVVILALGSVSRGADTQAVARQVMGLLRRRLGQGEPAAGEAHRLYLLAGYLDVPDGLRDVLGIPYWALREAADGHCTAVDIPGVLATLLDAHATEDRIGPGLGLSP